MEPQYDSSGLSTGIAVSDVFADFERKIISNRRRIYQAGLESKDFFATVLGNLDALNRANQEEAAKAVTESIQLVNTELLNARTSGINEVEKEFAGYIKQGYRAENVPEANVNSSIFLNARANTIFAIISAATFAVTNTREQALFVATQAGQTTDAETIDRLQTQILHKGVGGSRRSNNSVIELSSDAELLMRRSSHRVLIEAKGERQSEYGEPLIQISAHPSSCELCVNWQTKILVNDVYAGGTASGRYELLSTAIYAGLFHWNCRHTYITYIPGVTRTDLFNREQLSVQETAERYAIEQLQRENESHIREYKRAEAGLLTEYGQNNALKKVQEWQARQRALQQYAEHRGIPFYRQYEREQIGGRTVPSNTLNRLFKAA